MDFENEISFLILILKLIFRSAIKFKFLSCLMEIKVKLLSYENLNFILYTILYVLYTLFFNTLKYKRIVSIKELAMM